MYLTQEYFDKVMKQLSEHLEQIEKSLSKNIIHTDTQMSDGEKLFDNYDLCKFLNVSKRTLQRYRSEGGLPYQMIYHKTYYRESEVYKFIEKNFDRFRNFKKK